MEITFGYSYYIITDNQYETLRSFDPDLVIDFVFTCSVNGWTGYHFALAADISDEELDAFEDSGVDLVFGVINRSTQPGFFYP